MRNKGFTLIELITTFALTSVIIILLINTINVIRSIYSKTNIKTDLYINQSNLSNAMNKKINKDNLVSYSTCNDVEFCYVFNFVDGSSSKLTISNNIIKFGDFVYKLDENTRVDNPSVSKESSVVTDVTKNDSFLVIKIPIKSDIYPDIDFGINLIYPYNSTQTTLEV